MRKDLITLKKRIDILVCEKGLAESREKAKALIMAGLVYVNNQKFDKPGDTVDEESEIEVRGKGLRYVSRGGLKLEKAVESFHLVLQDLICMDVGASTGGFTDCMLQNGAAKVYSVDVGYGQLAWNLRTDERVINLERTNARYLTQDQVPDSIGFCSVDVSFISLDVYKRQGYAYSHVGAESGPIWYFAFLGEPCYQGISRLCFAERKALGALRRLS